MTGEKMRDVIGLYRAKFAVLGLYREPFLRHQSNPSRDSVLQHCYHMLDDMERFVDKGRLEKAFRWLGFIQGCLWVTGIYTVEELKNHNKS